VTRLISSITLLNTLLCAHPVVPVQLLGFFRMVCRLPMFSPETYGWSTFTKVGMKVTPSVLFIRNCNCSYNEFYIYHWYILYIFVKRDATINSERHVRTLKTSKQRIRRVRLNRNLKPVLLHDNARPHKGGECNNWVDFPAFDFNLFGPPEGCTPRTKTSCNTACVKISDPSAKVFLRHPHTAYHAKVEKLCS